MEDRRALVRVSMENNPPIRVDLNGADFVDVFYALDISRGGIGSWVPHRFDDCQTDRIVECLVKLPSPFNQSFYAQGKMRHIMGGRFGVQFHNLNESVEKLIDQYVNYRLKLESRRYWVSQHILSAPALHRSTRAA